MSNLNAFRTQLASIIEILANAAVAEICKLVDDGNADIQWKMSQSQKENEALKRKLQSMEIRIARGGAERSGARENVVYNCSNCVAILRETAAGGNFPVSEAAFYRLLVSGRTEGKAAAVEENRAPTPTLLRPTVEKCADMEKRTTEALLIKEERVEEDRDPLGEMDTREERAAEMCAGDEETASMVHKQNKPANHKTASMVHKQNKPANHKTASMVHKQNKPANHTEVLTDTEQHMTTHGVWEVSGLESALKVEGDDNANQRLQCMESEHSAQRLNSPGTEIFMYEKLHHPGMFFPHVEDGSVAKEYVYKMETETDNLSVHTEVQCTATTGETSGNSFSLPSLDFKPDIVITEPVNSEVAVNAPWSKETVPGHFYTQHEHSSVDTGILEMWTERNLRSSQFQGSVEKHTSVSRTNALDVSADAPRERKNTTSKGATRKRKYLCKHCGKGFPRAKDLTRHQRVHTGEKPFSCMHCGKRFSQSCNLKTHLSIHAAEKHFHCPQCGKQFSQSGSLKVHLRIHTGERPYSCVHCGKRFTQSCSLKKHQSIHMREHIYRELH